MILFCEETEVLSATTTTQSNNDGSGVTTDANQRYKVETKFKPIGAETKPVQLGTNLTRVQNTATV